MEIYRTMCHTMRNIIYLFFIFFPNCFGATMSCLVVAVTVVTVVAIISWNFLSSQYSAILYRLSYPNETWVVWKVTFITSAMFCERHMYVLFPAPCTKMKIHLLYYCIWYVIWCDVSDLYSFFFTHFNPGNQF